MMIPFKDSDARKHASDALEASRQHGERIGQQEKTIEQLRQEVSALNEKADQASKSNEEISGQAQKLLTAVRQLSDHVEEEVNSLKLTKNRMATAVVEAVQREMSQLTSSLRQDYDSYLGVKKELSTLSAKLSTLGQEIDKFKSISGTIKAMDFEMKSYARALEERDSEKLRLIRRIEELQKIIARERRIRR